MSQYTAMPDASAPPVYESVAPPGGVNPQQPAPQQNTAAPVVVVGANANPNAVLKQFAGVQPQPQPQATYAVLPQQPVVYYQQQPQQPLGAAPQQPAMSRDGQPAAAAAAAGAGAAATQYPGAYQYQPPQPQYAGQPLAQPMPHYVPGQPPQQYPGAAAYPGQPQMMGGGAGGAAVGGAAQTQGAQTVIYASGAPLPMYFTHQSQLVICPVCRAQAPTVVEYEPGLGTWAICCGLACVGCWVGCCLIPFCVPECQDATHRCPHCKNVVGRKALFS